MKKTNNPLQCWTLLILLSLYASPLSAAVFFVDSAAGNDDNSGTSTGSAWRALGKVNGTVFAPGDQILFKAGESWVGSLHPKGSGSPGNPIVIDQYGAGSKPLIDGNGVSGSGTTGGGAVYLFNQEYWEINNLEVVNDAGSDGERRGIHIAASNYGTVDHIHIKNCYVHNIRGRLSTTDGDLTAKRTGGIIVETISDSSTATRFNDVLIEGNTITTVRNQGIVAAGNRSKQNDYPQTSAWNARRASNLIIRGNTISDVTKNALILRLADSTCLVEWNVCFDTATLDTGNTMFTAACNGTVFQYNEGYRNHAGPTGDHDGSLYDADLRSTDIIFQYSYSHDNAHGLFWQYPSASGPNDNITVRYNISRNDNGNIFSFSGDSGGVSTTYIYNNVIYLPPGSDNLVVDARNGSHTYYMYNNIFYIEGSGVSYDFGSHTKTFDHNVFYGQHPPSEPSDANKITSDPLLVAPGSGGNGLASLGGYMLQAGSPAIDSGLRVANNGGLDFLGNAVPLGAAADRGAHEFGGTNTPPVILTQPQSVLALEGASASMSVTATAASPLTFQWRKFGSDIVTATNTMLAWGSVSITDAGNYDVVVANAFGTVTSAVSVLTAIPAGLPPIVTNLVVAVEAFIRGGADANTDQNEVADGQLRVKYSGSPFNYARKSYFQFDLSGLIVDPNTQAVFSVTTHASTYAHRAQLWGLNEAYAGFRPVVTWNIAQANDTTSNDLLTSGPETATMIGASLMFPNTGSVTYSFTIPRIGDFITGDHVTLVLAGADDAANDVGGLRLALNSAALEVTTLGTEPPVYTAHGTPYAWLDVFYTGLVSAPDYESADLADSDADTMAAWAEYRAGTIPTNAASVLRVDSVEVEGSNCIVSWQSVTGTSYSVTTTDGLNGTAITWDTQVNNITGLQSHTSHASVLSAASTAFFKIGLEKRELYLLIGQSNMAGRGPIELQDEVAVEGCELFRNPGDWVPAANPLNLFSTIRKDVVYQNLNPGYGFSQRMRELRPDLSLGLVVNARGGTAIREWAKGTTYYNDAVSRTKAAIADNGRLAGILWHQGESDGSFTNSYMGKLSNLIANLRFDLDAPDLPFIAGLVEMDEANYPGTPRAINEIIIQLPNVVSNTAVASSVGLETIDGTHFDSAGQRELGRRYADVLLSLE